MFYWNKHTLTHPPTHTPTHTLTHTHTHTLTHTHELLGKQIHGVVWIIVKTVAKRGVKIKLFLVEKKKDENNFNFLRKTHSK